MPKLLPLEEWRPAVGLEGLYEVSSYGRVKSLARVVTDTGRGGTARVRRFKERMMTPCPQDACGHLLVPLRNGGVTYRKWVHHLVLEAFVGPRPDGMEGCHFPDRNPANNCLTNLRWGTPKENGEDRVKHGTAVGVSRPGEANPFYGKTHNAETREKISAAGQRAWAEGKYANRRSKSR